MLHVELILLSKYCLSGIHILQSVQPYTWEVLILLVTDLGLYIILYYTPTLSNWKLWNFLNILLCFVPAYW